MVSNLWTDLVTWQYCGGLCGQQILSTTNIFLVCAAVHSNNLEILRDINHIVAINIWTMETGSIVVGGLSVGKGSHQAFLFLQGYVTLNDPIVIGYPRILWWAATGASVCVCACVCVREGSLELAQTIALVLHYPYIQLMQWTNNMQDELQAARPAFY